MRNFTLTQNAVDLAAEEWTSKHAGDGESNLPLKRITFDGAGTPHRSEAASFAKRRLRLQQVSLMARLFKTPITAASVSFSVFLPDFQSS